MLLNVLLVRRQFRGKLKATERVTIKEDTWVEPFSEILGLNDSEFMAWKDVFRSNTNHVLLVEGELDKKYLEHINSLGLPGYTLPENLEIVPYEGKDTLKNTILLKFIVEKFDNVFITFDLDAKQELGKIMQQIGLEDGVDYLAIGNNDSGKQCIEGLMPERILSDVHSKNTDLVMQLSAQDGKERKNAHRKLKQKILSAFQESRDIKPEDLKGFKKLFAAVAKSMRSSTN